MNKKFRANRATLLGKIESEAAKDREKKINFMQNVCFSCNRGNLFYCVWAKKNVS